MRDGWLSWPCWLTDSGRFNRKVVTHPASSLAQDRESSPAETSLLTTMLRRLVVKSNSHKRFKGDLNRIMIWTCPSLPLFNHSFHRHQKCLSQIAGNRAKFLALETMLLLHITYTGVKFRCEHFKCK